MTSLSTTSRILALDVGEKTVGMALSDSLGLTAQPLDTIVSQETGFIFDRIAQLCRKEDVVRIIVGLPLNMNGSEGPQARKARDFSHDLEIYLKKKGLKLPIDFQDERLSTVAAEKALLEADLSRNKRRKVINKTAAALILQTYLESLAAEDPERQR